MASAAALAFALGVQNEHFGDDLHILARRLGPIGWADLPALLAQNWWGELAQPRHYRPLTTLLLGLERVAFGMNALPYHLVGLALHAGASVMAWRLLHALGFGAAALAAGLLFAVHPIHAEPVLAAYGQADLLVALFMLGSLERYVAFMRQGGQGPLLASYALFFAALGCKETAFVFPALVVLTRGVLLRPEARGISRWFGAAELGYAAPFLGYLAIRFLVLARLLPPPNIGVAQEFPFWLRVKTVMVTLAHDVRLAVLPTGQSMQHGQLNSRVVSPALPEATGLAVLFVGLSLATRVTPRGHVAYAAGWFAITVAPVSGIVPLAFLVSERNLYLPSLGATLLLGMLLTALRERAGRRLATAVLVALVAVGVGASWRVAWTWRTPVSLWEDVAARHPDYVTGWLWLGGAHVRRARVAEGSERIAALSRSREAYDRALALEPDRREAQVGRAAVALLDGDCARALDLLETPRAEESRPAGALADYAESEWFRAHRARCRTELGRTPP